MNLLSEDFLSRAALSDQQYRNICGRELRDHSIESLHRRTMDLSD
jgi:hypothetical protein